MKNAKTQEQFAIAVQKATTGELVKFYNEKTGKDIKKFSSRAAGEKQCLSLFVASKSLFQDAKPVAQDEEAVLPAEAINTGRREPETAITGRRQAERRGAAAQPKAAPKAAQKQKVAADSADRSAAIAASWKNNETKEKRAARHHVHVSGKEYRSVKAAFEELGLPLSQHIKFRMLLKEKGTATFQGHKFRAEER